MEELKLQNQIKLGFISQILGNQADSSRRFSEAINTITKLHEYYLSRCEKIIIDNSENLFLQGFHYAEKVEELRYVKKILKKVE